jgi:hypothetical protein
LQKNGIIPNLNLLQNHGIDGSFNQWKIKNGIGQKNAFCLKFSKLFNNQGTRTLYYVGAIHTTDPSSDTHQIIKHIITDLKPDVVVIEGVPYSRGMSPELKHLSGDEGSHAIGLAKKHHIPYSGIEESEEDIFMALSKKYKPIDIMGFIFLRTHKYCYKTLKMSFESFIDDFNKHEMKYMVNIFGKKLSKINPLVWFRNVFGREFIYGQNLELATPNFDSDIITHKISFDYSKDRDLGNIINLYKFINSYQTVLYIMGQNHVYADSRVLEKTFGKYSIIKPGK